MAHLRIEGNIYDGFVHGYCECHAGIKLGV